MGARRLTPVAQRTARGAVKPSRAAKYLDMDVRGVYELLKAGEVPFFILANGQYRIFLDDLDLFLLRQRGRPAELAVEEHADELLMDLE